MKDVYNIYLVSDFTGDTANHIYKAIESQFPNIKKQKHIWPLVRKTHQVDKLIKNINTTNSIVVCTIFYDEIHKYLLQECEKIQIPCINITTMILGYFASFFKTEITPSHTNILNKEYFSKIKSIEYTLSHDDGQNTNNLKDVDIIIIGVSRTSKTPTSIYLSYKGYKVSNVPFVEDNPLVEQVLEYKDKLIVGLTINADRLIQVRSSRIENIGFKFKNLNYIEKHNVLDEIKSADSLFRKNNIPTIDVTEKSVEETAAIIIKLYHKKTAKQK